MQIWLQAVEDRVRLGCGIFVVVTFCCASHFVDLRVHLCSVTHCFRLCYRGPYGAYCQAHGITDQGSRN
jgi:hypothetical protein